MPLEHLGNKERRIMQADAARKATALVISLGLAGCATAPRQQGGPMQTLGNTFNNPDPCSNNSRNIGIAIGTGLGVLLGAGLSKKDPGATLAGAGIGAFVGGMIGTDMDNKRCELAKVARQYQLDLAIATVANDGTVISDAQMGRISNSDAIKKSAIGSVVSVRDQAEQGGHFMTNSAILTPRAREYFAAIADSYNTVKNAAQMQNPQERNQYLHEAQKRRILLIGHTDDTGQSRLNSELSEQRARAVALFLEQRGIQRDSMFYQGAGEIYPIADNNSESGRAQNRRVEIVEVASDQNLRRYIEVKTPNYRFYRPEDVASTASAQAAISTQHTPSSRRNVRAALPDNERAEQKPSATGQTQKRGPVTTEPAVVVQPRPSAERAEPQVAARTVPSATSDTSATAGRKEPVPPSARIESGLRQAPVPTSRSEINFGGVPLSSETAVLSVGRVAAVKPWFSLVSSAYADEPVVMSDCSRDRPRVAGAVKALKNGATYAVAEHVPSLYGKTWTDKVNGHQVVVNKVAVLASEGSLAQIPDFKVYANYNPTVNRNQKPDVYLTPEVNIYVGEGGILYRIFAKGAAGLQCVDVLYNKTGGASAKAGKIIYANAQKLYVADFRPSIVN